MRIGINALAVSPERPGGDVSYVLELVRRLPALDPQSEWLVFGTPWARELIGELPANAKLVPCAVPPGSMVRRALWEQTALVATARRASLDVLFAPINVLPLAYAGRTVLTLHEAEPFMPGSQIPLPLVAWWRVMRSLSARRASRILTVSDAARQQIVRWMGIPARRQHVVHLGVDLTRFSPSAHDLPHPLDGSPYVLWVGRVYPRKNLGTLLDAFAELQRARRPERLVLLGPPGWNEAALQRRIATEFEPGRVVRLPAVWSDLSRWYAHARAFAFPSTQETFGLPLLEAMACGTPVVAGDIPALREVGADAALYVNPARSDRLAHALDRLLTDANLRTSLSAAGLARVGRFSWHRTAQETLGHLRAAADERSFSAPSA